jgi:hypothetical protein
MGGDPTTTETDRDGPRPEAPPEPWTDGWIGGGLRRSLRRSITGTARYANRAATIAGRPLPDTFIVGAQKAGTTSLFDHLVQHPRVVGALTKEPHFFDGPRRPLWMCRLDYPRVRAAERSGGRVLEATPSYLASARAAARLSRALPNARFIALLRDPATRALSHYKHNRRYNVEPFESFADALEAEQGRLERGFASHDGTQRSLAFARRHLSYATRGLYVNQLRRYFDLFGRSRVLVLFSEELFEKPEVAVHTIEGFLGLPHHDFPSFPRSNAGSGGADNKTDEDIERGLHALRERFAEPNRALAELLGRELPWQQ